MEDLFKQVNILRGGGGRASVVSMAEGDESAYGSVSGRSSLVSTLDRFGCHAIWEFETYPLSGEKGTASWTA